MLEGLCWDLKKANAPLLREGPPSRTQVPSDAMAGRDYMRRTDQGSSTTTSANLDKGLWGKRKPLVRERPGEERVQKACWRAGNACIVEIS